MINWLWLLVKNFVINNKTYFLFGGLLIFSVGMAHRLGINQGQLISEQKYTAQQAQQSTNVLNQFIESAKQLTKAANDASSALSQQIVERKHYDEQSTRAFQEALNTTASNRVNCVFDDSVLRFIDAARESASRATTGGITSNTDSAVRTPRKTP